MNRRVQTIQLQATGGGQGPDTYFDKVVKLLSERERLTMEELKNILPEPTKIKTEA